MIDFAAVVNRIAKQRPPTLFEGAFFDMKEKLKATKKTLADQAVAQIEQRLRGEVKGLVSVEVKLGKFRGSYFVTSCPVSIKMPNQQAAEKFAEVLRGRYSPKFQLKSYEGGMAIYNVR